MRSSTKTSVDILRERDMLAARVRELEGILAATRTVLDVAMDAPQLHREALQRMAKLVRECRPDA